jgi:hypothetical protein
MKLAGLKLSHLILSVLAAVTLALAGCGGGDEEVQTEDTTEQATGGEEQPADDQTAPAEETAENPCAGGTENPCGEAPAP